MSPKTLVIFYPGKVITGAKAGNSAKPRIIRLKTSFSLNRMSSAQQSHFGIRLQFVL